MPMPVSLVSKSSPQGAQARLWLAAKEHLELVPQDQILECKLVAGTTAIHKDAKQHQDKAQHRGGHIKVGFATG